MSFFARRGAGGNGAADQDFGPIAGMAEPELIPPPGSPAPPPPAMADALLRKFTGMGFSDVQGAAAEAGEMLAGYKASLERIEAHLAAISDRLAALESRK